MPRGKKRGGKITDFLNSCESGRTNLFMKVALGKPTEMQSAITSRSWEEQQQKESGKKKSSKAMIWSCWRADRVPKSGETMSILLEKGKKGYSEGEKRATYLSQVSSQRKSGRAASRKRFLFRQGNRYMSLRHIKKRLEAGKRGGVSL